jgi:hypothetical protein
MTHIFYARYLPFDLLSTFDNQKDEMIKHLIGESAVQRAIELDCSLTLLTGAYDFNSQMVQVGIKIQGPDERVTFWLLAYQPK